MSNSNEFYVGGPGCFGFDMQSAEDVTRWIADTPEGHDPLEFMTASEIEAAQIHAPNLLKLSAAVRNSYFSLIRTGASLAMTDEIAAYDNLI
jgi:hypothetical protein